MKYQKITRQRREELKLKWAAALDAARSSTNINPDESYAEKMARVKRLESNHEDWFRYYFPNFSYAEPAPFHIRASNRVIKNARHFEGRPWSRELAKSSRTFMEFMYLALTGKVRNVLMISSTFDNACELLQPFRANLEANRRIINDYGEQKNQGSWEDGRFVTKKGVAFRAVGAKQNPRGSRKDEVRPDGIIFDDVETDEMSRNPDRTKDVWNWIEQAVIPTVSVSGNIRVVFCGNIISTHGIMARAKDICDSYEIVNIRDENGHSTWPQKNSEEHIDYILSKLSWISAQKEYFNNPIAEGTVFKDIRFGKCPKLKDFKMLVAYGDPAPSNNENKQNSSKALWLIGEKDGTFYVLKGFLEQARNARFVGWYWDLNEFVNGQCQTYNYIENNALQDPFYEQVFLPMFSEQSKVTGTQIYVTPDNRKKPDKFTRIEGTLEPLNRLGKLVFNEDEKDCPHMKRLKDQFKAITPQLSAPADGPDAIEGGVSILQNKIRATASAPKFGSRSHIKSKSKYHF